MPFETPTNLRPGALRTPRHRKALSHERLLEVCYAYKRLRERVLEIQTSINLALEEFQHSTHSQESLARMMTTLASIDGGIGIALHNDFIKVELETLNWEQRSSKLQSEARRQARVRAARTEGRIEASLLGRGAYLTGSNAGDPDELLPGDVFGASPEGENPSSASPPRISPTMALALRGMDELPPNLDEPNFGDAPSNEGYKKSGLV